MPRLSLEPRMLTKAQAASYCGVGLTRFTGVCPVHPIDIGVGAPRYDRTALDRWLDSMGGSDQKSGDYWTEKLLQRIEARGR